MRVHHACAWRLVPSAIAALAGTAMAVPPPPFPAMLELSSLDGDNGFVINGIDAFDNSGISVSSAGDVNGDGIGDLIIGAWGAHPNGQIDAGESYVVFGTSTGFTASLNVSALNGTNGFVVNGVDVNDVSGRSVSFAGDVNGDGIGDLIIGAPYADPNGQTNAGESYVVFGKSTGFAASINLSALNGTNGFVLNGVDAGDRSGRSVSSAGDVNGDGIGDLIIGAGSADPNGQTNAGESYVVFGGLGVGASGSLNLSTLNGTNGFVVNGIDVVDLSGSSVSSAGDVNDDGIDDLIIGALNGGPNGQTTAGESYVVFGKDTAVDGPFAASLDLSALDGTDGFVVNGIEARDNSGRSVSSAGDINGDGIDDLIIGAPGWSSGPVPGAWGESYLVFGRGPAPSCTGDTTGDGLTNSSDFNVLASHFGMSVTPNTNGDLTGDGIVNSADFNVLAGDFGCGS